MGPLETHADRDMRGLPRGPELATMIGHRMRIRAPMAMPPTRTPEPLGLDTDDNLIMTWDDFQQRHPEWMGDFWAECRALYAGGQRLLGDKSVLERLFPKNLHEPANLYEARKCRAHYFPYPGTIVDNLLAGLGTDPLKVSFAEVDGDGKASLPAAAEWWERWITDVTDEAERPADYGLDDDDEEDDDEGGRTMHHFLVDALREAMQTRSAWVLADLPPADPEAPEPTSRLDAERSGMLDPYLCLVPSEQVIDWQCDDAGELEWVLVMRTSTPRPTPRARRKIVRYTFVLWDAEAWLKYEVDVDPANLPAPATPYRPTAGGRHNFGRVPLERLEIPEGMHAMGKLHSLAREHFNKRCAMSWAEYRSLFPTLYEFNGPEDKGGLPVAEAQQDAGRATNQIRGQGWTQVRGQDDRAEWVGPSADPYVAARESCNDLMREMHRVMYSMAQSADQDSAAKHQSGESKEADHGTTATLLDALGTIMRRFLRRLFVLAALGRGEAPPTAYVSGLEQFDVQGTSEAIAEAVEFFNGVPQKSPRAMELALARLYFKYLGDAATQEDRETIRDQIRDSISAEELMMAAGGMPGVPPPKDGVPQPTPSEDDDEEEEGGKPKGEPPPRKGPMVSSRRTGRRGR